MKKLLILFVAILSITPAYADGGHGGGGHGYYGGGYGGWGWGGAWIYPALVGGVIVYGLTQPQTVYVQPQPGVAPAQSQYWYFCAASNAYYPYASSCPGGWQAVLATPPVIPNPPAPPNNGYGQAAPYPPPPNQ